MDSVSRDRSGGWEYPFSEFVSFMEMDYKESLKAYLDVLESHVHSEFAQKKTKIMELFVEDY